MFPLLLVACLLFIIMVIVSLIWYKSRQVPQFIANSRILLAIAHPDDEAMCAVLIALFSYFFQVFRANNRQPVKSAQRTFCYLFYFRLHCLLLPPQIAVDDTRREELIKSCRTLGIQPAHVVVINDPFLPVIARSFSREVTFGRTRCLQILAFGL